MVLSTARKVIAGQAPSVNGQPYPISATGKYINGLAFRPTDWGDEGTPIIRIQNLTDPGKPMNRTTRKVDPIFIVQAGDLLVSWSATLDAFIWDREPALLNQHIFKVIPDTSLVSKKFLFYSLRRAIAEMTKSEHVHGSTMKHINRGPFLAHTIHVPSLTAQDEIVAEIEKQFSRLDEAVANLKRVKANLKRYKTAVLKAAVEGHLVPTEADLARREGRDYEPGAELLRRIRGVRGSQWKRRGASAEPALSATDQKPSLPVGWVWTKSETLFDFVTSGSRGWAQHYSDRGSVFIRVGNLDHQTIDLNLSSIQYVRAPKGPEADRSRIQPGDLVISITAELGMIALIPKTLGEAYVNQHVAIARPTELMDSGYLAWFFASSHAGKRQLEAMRRGATKAGLGLDDICSVVVGLPPLAEQRRIVREIDRRLSNVYEAENEVNQSLERANILKHATLANAFSSSAPHRKRIQ